MDGNFDPKRQTSVLAPDASSASGRVPSSEGPHDALDLSVGPIQEPEPSSFTQSHLPTGWENPFQSISSPLTRRIKQTWAVGGGKGGVGKSLISSSLAISLARQGNRVIAVDLDLGGANLHTTLGVDLPKQSLSDFLSSRVSALESCLVDTSVPGLSFISGAQDAMRVADITLEQKVHLLQKLIELDADYLVFDLGAGTNHHTIDFFLFSDIGLITLLPEPTSIENGYRFIKSAYYRRLEISPHLAPIQHLVRAAMENKNILGIRNPTDLLREVNKMSPELSMRLKEEIDKFRPKLIVNQARTQTDVDIGFSVKTVCKKYFGTEMDYVGYLDYDSSVWQAVRRKRPLMMEFPNSKLVSSFDRVTQYLLKRHGDYRNDLF